MSSTEELCNFPLWILPQADQLYLSRFLNQSIFGNKAISNDRHQNIYAISSLLHWQNDQSLLTTEKKVPCTFKNASCLFRRKWKKRTNFKRIKKKNGSKHKIAGIYTSNSCSCKCDKNTRTFLNLFESFFCHRVATFGSFKIPCLSFPQHINISPDNVFDFSK